MDTTLNTTNLTTQRSFTNKSRPVTKKPEKPEIRGVKPDQENKTPRFTTVEKKRTHQNTPRSNMEKSVLMTGVQKEVSEEVTGKGPAKETKTSGKTGGKGLVKKIDETIDKSPVTMTKHFPVGEKEIQDGKNTKTTAFIRYKADQAGDGDRKDVKVEAKVAKDSPVSIKSPAVKVYKKGSDNIEIEGPSISIKKGKADVNLATVRVYKEQDLGPGRLQEGVEVGVKGELAARGAARAVASTKSAKVVRQVVKEKAPEEIKKRAKKAATEAMAKVKGEKSAEAGMKAAKKEARKAMKEYVQKEAVEKGEKLSKKAVKKAANAVVDTTVKMSTKQAAETTTKTGLKVITKSIPLIGNAINLVFAGIDGYTAVKTQLDPNASASDKAVAWGHLGTSAVGIAIPWVGAAGDVADASYQVGKAIGEAKK